MGGLLLGATSNIVPAVFKGNAIGLFGFAEMSMSDLMQIAPGFAGIGLSQNPSGAIGQVTDAYRDVSRSRLGITVAVAVPGLLWVAAKTELISNWSFTAAITVFVFGVVALVPALSEIPGRGFAVARGALVIGQVPLLGSDAPAPSPDFIGIDAPLTRSDVVDAEQALGVRDLLVEGRV